MNTQWPAHSTGASSWRAASTRPVQPIVLFPHPVLKQVCEPVDPADPRSQAVARDLLETLDSAPGVGIAAPQIGQPLRIAVVDATRSLRHSDAGQGRLVLFNPEIVHCEGEQRFREGCLSIPQYTGNIRRAARITVRALGLDGVPFQLSAEAFEAVVFQHELDHLDGILFLDRITDLKADLFCRKPLRAAAD
jgi:peptide deformylase